MRKKYPSSQLKEILHLCVWRCQRTLDNPNLEHVAQQIKFDRTKYQNEVTGRYLIDLLKKINSGDNKSVTIDLKIFNNVLLFIDFTDFENFQDQKKKLSNYLDLTRIDFSKYTEQKTAIIYPTEESYTVEKYLTAPQKEVNGNYELISSPEDDLMKVIEEIENLRKEFPFIIWYISTEWKDQFDNLTHKNFITEALSTKQIIPIFIGDSLFSTSIISPNLKTGLCLSGMIAVFMALFHIDEEVKKSMEKGVKNENIQRGGVHFSGNFHGSQIIQGRWNSQGGDMYFGTKQNKDSNK